MDPMTNHSAPALAQLQTWHEQQNPLVRALTEPLLVMVGETLGEMQRVIDEQAAMIPALQAEVRDRKAEVLVQRAEDAEQRAAADAEQAMALQVTKDRIDQLERHVFGKRSEQRPKTPDARDEARKRHRAEQTPEQKAQHRATAADARQDRLEKLRTETLVLPLQLDEEARESGRPMPALTSVIYEWRAGELVRVVVQREQRVLADGAIVTAPPPPQVVEGGIYGPGLHAKVVMDKCLNAMPLHRQERAFGRLGAPLPVSALCAMFHRSSVRVEPVYRALLAHAGSAEHVSADETPQPVQDKNKVRCAWMWVFATEDAIVYVYSPSRGGAVAKGVLGDSKGTLTVDGHTGYNLVTQANGRARGGCWSHGRRGLFEARGYNAPLVDEMMTLIGELFYIEQIAQEQGIVGSAAHLALRQSRSAPVITSLYALVDAQVGQHDARSSLAKALQYLRNQRGPLTLFLTNPQVPIHNNLSERCLRVVALLRKNALFVGHDEGGESLAMLLTMAATCRLHEVDPEKWLADVLIRVSEPGSTVEELLPWNWKIGRGRTFAPMLVAA